MKAQSSIGSADLWLYHHLKLTERTLEYTRFEALSSYFQANPLILSVHLPGHLAAAQTFDRSMPVQKRFFAAHHTDPGTAFTKPAQQLVKRDGYFT